MIMVKLRIAFTVPVALLLVACPAPEDPGGVSDSQSSPDDEDESESETEPEIIMTGATMTGPTPPDTDTSETETSDPDPPDPTACNFICVPDGTPDDPCDIWDQDCPDGEKCMPWANDGGNAWNALTCAPIEADAGQPGDPCTVEGSGVSGHDSCDTASMSWNVDPETGEGTCVAFCAGTRENPVCDDPETDCVIANDGVLPLCLPSCDPLLQNCPDGQACYPGEDSFVCVPDASGPDLGGYGDPCAYTNACDPGLLCAGAVAVPGCQSALCCTEFCDVSEADPDAQCQGQGDGQQCLGLFEEGEIPPGAEDYGFCALPG
jgi:hypothetical protein